MKQDGQTPLFVIPMTLKAANAFVSAHHRHHAAVPAGLDYFRIGAIDEQGTIRAVAIVSRPPNYHSDDGTTCEVVRLSSDGTPNACSFLYSASARIARLMGFHRMITYTLENESGVSLRAAGWKLEKTGIKSWWHSHQVPGRTVRAREHYAILKQRWSAPQMEFNLDDRS